jgi:hypothetical protein
LINYNTQVTHQMLQKNTHYYSILKRISTEESQCLEREKTLNVPWRNSALYKGNPAVRSEALTGMACDISLKYIQHNFRGYKLEATGTPKSNGNYTASHQRSQSSSGHNRKFIELSTFCTTLLLVSDHLHLPQQC